MVHRIQILQKLRNFLQHFTSVTVAFLFKGFQKFYKTPSNIFGPDVLDARGVES